MTERNLDQNSYQQMGDIRLQLSLSQLEDSKDVCDYLAGASAVVGIGAEVAALILRKGFRGQNVIRGITLAGFAVGIMSRRFFNRHAEEAAEEVSHRIKSGNPALTMMLARRIEQRLANDEVLDPAAKIWLGKYKSSKEDK